MVLSRSRRTRGDWYDEQVRRPQPLGPESLVATLARNMYAGRRGAMTAVLMQPSHAQVLARYGWSKQDVINYLVTYGRVPVYPSLPGEPVGPREVHGAGEPQDLAPAWDDADRQRLVVCGGTGSVMALWTGPGGGQSLGMRTPGASEVLPGLQWVMKRVELPARWGQLVDRYRSLVRRYEI